jgi:hypothetical protein
MHPDMAREISKQSAAELRERAGKDRDARTARAAARDQRARAAKADAAPVPSVPDYVDGTFRARGGRMRAS